MIRKITLYVAFVILTFFTGCNSPSDETANTEKLRKEVIAIHDEVMPLMGEIMSLKKRLLTDTAALDNTTLLSRKEAAALLEAAHEGMFVWMRQYKADLTGLSTEEQIEYLQEQRKSVELVNINIKSSMEQAKQILGD
jgi:hypothetical protein